MACERRVSRNNPLQSDAVLNDQDSLKPAPKSRDRGAIAAATSGVNVRRASAQRHLSQ
jgi:hypothetical protein